MMSERIEDWSVGRRVYFLPDWVTDEQVEILCIHYYDEIDTKGYRYRVAPYSLSESFCIIDDHTDKLYHHQRGNTKTQRVWSSQSLVDAINYAEMLSLEHIKIPHESTHLSQKIAYTNQTRKAKQEAAQVPQSSPFSMCDQCHRMTKKGHACNAST
jgi:hypothetical protein